MNQKKSLYSPCSVIVSEEFCLRSTFKEQCPQVVNCAYGILSTQMSPNSEPGWATVNQG